MTDPENIYNWRRVDGRLTTSGQPSEVQLEEIAQLGVTHIINLGMHDHKRALADERASLVSLGIDYTHIPVEFDSPKTEDFNRFCETLAKIGDAPVHVHCIANLRVTAFLYKYRRDVLDLDEAEARGVMDTVWRPGGVWAEFIGDMASAELAHRPPPDVQR